LSGAEIKIFPGTKRPVLAQRLAPNIFLFEQKLKCPKQNQSFSPGLMKAAA